MTFPNTGGVVIAGERSGVGKTTITLALLAALGKRSRRVQSFKVGPDYIDPMFHRYMTGRPCYNLDPILTSETYVQQVFAAHCQEAEFAVVEGVMGLFDGATGHSDVASTAHLAKLLNLPVLLVVDCSRLSRSVLAIIHGYRTLDPNLHLAGVILNRVGSDRHLDLLETALESMDLPIFGALRRQSDIAIPDRHLGLVPTVELPHMKDLGERLCLVGEQAFNWPLMQTLVATSSAANHAAVLTAEADVPTPQPRIAVAYDAAFNFYYPDNLEILQSLGAELLFWSPLRDAALPEAAQGFYFGGGFPEMFAAELSSNQRVLEQINQRLQNGTPAYAECGGLMYLAEALIDLDGNSWPMAGVLPTTVKMSPRLTLGYRQATALQPSPLVQVGKTLWGHEFHRSETTNLPSQPLYRLRRYDADQFHAEEGWSTHNTHASYVHVHWGGARATAASFVHSCKKNLRGI